MSPRRTQGFQAEEKNVTFYVETRWHQKKYLEASINQVVFSQLLKEGPLPPSNKEVLFSLSKLQSARDAQILRAPGKTLKNSLAGDQQQHLLAKLQWQNGKFWSFQLPGIPNLNASWKLSSPFLLRNLVDPPSPLCLLKPGRAREPQH